MRTDRVEGKGREAKGKRREGEVTPTK